MRRLLLVEALLMFGRGAAPAVERVQLHGVNAVATVHELGVAPGASHSYAVEIVSDDELQFLAVELWYKKPRDAPTPDPMLMVAKDRAPVAFYSTLMSTAGEVETGGQLETNATFCDTTGFMLTSARQFVGVPAAQLEAGWWFVTVTNVPVWSSGMLDFHLELRLTDAPPCQASCSGHGTCRPNVQCATPQSGDSSASPYGHSATSRHGLLLAPQSVCTGRCACEEGWGGVDCATVVAPIMPLADETDTPRVVPLSTPTIVKVNVPLGNDPAAITGAADTGGWRYYSVTVDRGAVTTLSPRFSTAPMDDTTTSWPGFPLAGFISAELQLPTDESSPEHGGSYAAKSIEGCQALLYFKHEDDGFTRLPSHYDFQQYSDPLAYYGGLARFHVDLALRTGRYIVGVYTTPASETAQGAGTGSAGTTCPPAVLTVSACPSGNALECSYYAMGSSSAQARLFIVMLIAAALPVLCCLPTLVCHALGWLTGSETDDPNDQQQYQRLDVPRPGLTSAEIAAHTIPIVFNEPLPPRLLGEHCSICIGEFEEGEGLRQLKCSHFFHAECIDEWLGKKDTCPLCKSSAVHGPGRPRSAGPAGISVGVAVAAGEGPGQTMDEATVSEEMRLLDGMDSHVDSEGEAEPEPEPEQALASTERNPMHVP